MNTACQARTFQFRMRSWFGEAYGEYLHWYRHLAERLGPQSTDKAWRGAFENRDDEFLTQILSTGWSEDDSADGDAAAEIERLVSKHFPSATNGVPVEKARQVVDTVPAVHHIRQRFPSLNVSRPMTTYEALHLLKDGFARIAEALIDRHGKKGELIIYDILLEEIARADFKQLSVEEFMAQRTARFKSAPEEHDMHSAGLDVELVRASEREIVTHVTHCEWARYYRERHPRVGYLMSCSRDEAAYRAFNKNLRMERTMTLMEGGDKCDFRLYAVNQQQ